MNPQEPDGMDTERSRSEGATRRDLLSSVACLPVAAAIPCLVTEQAFSWAGRPSSGGGQQAKNPLAEKLHAEYAEECQVYCRYSAFAAKAKEDGYPNIAKLFRAVAEAEKIHAAAILFVMGVVGETAQNLAASADYEEFLSTEVLPKSVRHAEEDRDYAASEVLNKFLAASRIHRQAFREGLGAVNSGHDMGDMPIHVCPVCGAVLLGGAQESCPVCRTPGSMFRTVT